MEQPHPLPERIASTAPKLRCPSCGQYESRVVRTLEDPAGHCVPRQRECLWCGYRYKTREILA